MRLRLLGLALLALLPTLSACSAGGEHTLAGDVRVKSSHLPANLTSSIETKNPPLNLVKLSKTIKLGPSGPLKHPVTVTIPLNRKVPSDMAVVVATTEMDSGPWSYLPVKLSADRRSASFTATHFSIFTVIGQFFGATFDEFKTLFLDGLDSGATMTVNKPSCTGEAQARSDGYSITSSSTDAVYWCFGMSGTNRVLKVVNDRRYPMEIAHPNLSVSQGGSIDWAQLSSLSHFGSGLDTILAPGDQVTYQVNVPQPGQGGIQTQMDGLGQSLYALQTGVETMIEILTKFGAGGASSAADTTGKFLGIPSCADSLNKGPGALVSGCFSPSDLLKAFGTAGLLLAPIVAVGGLVAFFHSEWNALVDQFNGHDKYTVTITRGTQSQQPTLGIKSAAECEGCGQTEPSSLSVEAYSSGGFAFPGVSFNGIKWQSWGASQAMATANGVYGGNGDTLESTLIAFNLGSCDDQYSYQAVEWLSGSGATFDPTSYFDTCTGRGVGSGWPPSTGTAPAPIVAEAASNGCFFSQSVASAITGVSMGAPQAMPVTPLGSGDPICYYQEINGPLTLNITPQSYGGCSPDANLTVVSVAGGACVLDSGNILPPDDVVEGVSGAAFELSIFESNAPSGAYTPGMYSGLLTAAESLAELPIQGGGSK